MNQIIVVKSIYKKRQRFFQLQLVVSILALLVLLFFSFVKGKRRREMSQISDMMNQVFQVETIYATCQKESSQAEKQYFCKIRIPKINLEYSVFNRCDEELLQILPCRFYGAEIGERGNIAIAGHNYEDDRFFGNLNQLKKGDTIYLEDLKGTKYRYLVYDKYKVTPDDFSCLTANRKYDLTLVTCDNVQQKRLIIKASR